MNPLTSLFPSGLRCAPKTSATALTLALALSTLSAGAREPLCISTTEAAPWVRQAGLLPPPNPAAGTNLIDVKPETQYQTIKGFGGCFNELGWEALQSLTPDQRDAVMRALFDTRSGCGFNFGRMPIGASDFAKTWYSLDDVPGDYALNHFSIQRDQGCLIPYLKAALAVNPRLQIWGSAWSPPVWLKQNKDYRNGTNRLSMDPQTLTTYAHYLEKYVQAYQAAGIPVYAVHVQNEPASTQVFPSCLWSGTDIRDFVRDYMGPIFAQDHIPAQIWLGTINKGDINAYATPVLTDPAAAKYITGVGYQWDGKHAIAQTHERFPQFELMETESECGGGENNWKSALHTWDLLDHYLGNWANTYMYWNMVLDERTISSWGWKQNALITINTPAHAVVYNPEFYVMKHFSAFVLPGAKRIAATGDDLLAFQNADGSIVVVGANKASDPKIMHIRVGDRVTTAIWPANSFNTVVCQ